jgi:mannitol/fructose-specific phosphotransferase system IIA component (Ntr-type)
MREIPQITEKNMTLGKFTETKLLVPRLLSTDHMGAIKELTKRLYLTGRIDDSLAFFQAVVEREYMLHSTPERGVVFPHARGHGVNTLSFAVGISAEGVPWGSFRGPLARVVLLLAIPLSETQVYLNLLSSLSRFFQEEASLTSLCECRQPEEMFTLFDSIVPLSNGSHGSSDPEI